MDPDLNKILAEIKLNNSRKAIDASLLLKGKLISKSSKERLSTLRQLYTYSPKFIEILSCLNNAESVYLTYISKFFSLYYEDRLNFFFPFII